MGGAENNVAALQGVHAVEENGDIGIGGGDDAGDDALGMGHEGQVAALVMADHAYGFLVLDGVPHAVGRAGVLGDLVGDVAKARFGHRFRRQLLRVGRKGLAAHPAQLVDLLLRIALQLRQRLAAVGDQLIDQFLIFHILPPIQMSHGRMGTRRGQSKL